MNTTSVIDSTALEKEHDGAVLLDVRLADDFEEAHLPGAVNNCVFEVAFGERLKELAPDQTAPVIVYGAGAASHESRLAADKLERLGYREVRDYREGLAGWIAEGRETVQGTPVPAGPDKPDGRLAIDLSESAIEWTGRNLLNKHYGSIALKGGYLQFDHGVLTGGEFVIDLTAMHCADLEGDLHDLLIAHLKSDDFFDVERFPEARYVIRASEPLEGALAGRPNLRLEGELTLRGETRPLTIEAATGLTPDGLPAAQATLALDRTLWGSIYGSARFFTRLGMHLVNDLVDLQLRVVTSAPPRK